MATDECTHVLQQVRALQPDEQRQLLHELTQLVRQASEPRGDRPPRSIVELDELGKACGKALSPIAIYRRSDAGGMARALVLSSPQTLWPHALCLCTSQPMPLHSIIRVSVSYPWTAFRGYGPHDASAARSTCSSK